ncbi:MAG: hypothetical protein KY460_13155 [Actinobacteria bacterium]|nr:hypothetical protein [Actinomycetota bacterium]
MSRIDFRSLRSPGKPRIKLEDGEFWVVTCYLCVARRVAGDAVQWVARDLRAAARLAGEHHASH